MASEPEKGQRNTVLWRRQVKIAVIAFLALLICTGLSTWLMLTEQGARTVWMAVSTLSGNTVRAIGVQGRMVGPLHLDRLEVQSQAQTVILQSLDLDWCPSRLMQGKVHVDSVHIGRLDVVAKEKDVKEPARLPESIDLPFLLQVDQARIDGGILRVASINPIQLGATVFNVDYDGVRYRLGIQALMLEADTETGKIDSGFRGEVTLSRDRPYALHVDLASDGEARFQKQILGARGRLHAEGSLSEIRMITDLTINQMKVNGHAIVRPFSQSLFGKSELAIQGVDLALIKQGLPHTDLKLILKTAEDGAGDLVMSNKDAGFYVDSKLPVRDIQVVFRQSLQQLVLERIVILPGSARQSAGLVEGKGRYADGQWAIDLSTGALDIQKIDQRLRPTQLSGQIQIRHAAGRQELTAALTEPLGNARKIGVTMHAVLADNGLTIDRAELQAGGGHLSMTGHIDLARDQSFSAAAVVDRFRLQDIGDFLQMPDIFLNGRFSVKGVRKPELSAELAFTITDSRIAGQPLQGEGHAQLRSDRLEVSGLSLVAGVNRLQAQGKLSPEGGQLSFMVAAPRLAQFGPGFSGALDASGTVHGSFRQPHINAAWKAQGVRLRGYLQIDSMRGKADVDIDPDRPGGVRSLAIDVSAHAVHDGSRKVEDLSVQGQYAAEENAPLYLAVQAHGIEAGGIRADGFALKGEGTTKQHQLEAKVAEPGQEWMLKVQGGLQLLKNGARWSGSMQGFDATGRFTARLSRPAPIIVSREHVQLDHFQLESTLAVVTIEQFLRDKNGMVTRGRLERLQVAQVLELAHADSALATDLQLSGEWDITVKDTLNGTVRIQRNSGDMTMRGSVPVTAGLRRLEATAHASGGQVTVQLQAEGQQLGRIDVNAKADVKGKESPFVLSRDTPISAQAMIDIPSLGWMGMLVSPTLLAEGRLQSAVSMTGTMAQPHLDGQIHGDGLRLLFADTGVDLKQGKLDSTFQDSRLLIRQLQFDSPTGKLAASGQIDLIGRQPNARITVTANRYTLFDRVDRVLRISGESQIAVQEGHPAITGSFRVDAGFFDVGRLEMPKLSDDVVIVGRQKKKTAERGIPAAIDVAIALGDGIQLKGRGVDALLAGELRLASTSGAPLRAQGLLRVAKGTFSAYGRELVIEQGGLRFNGPLENPALDILAMRRGQEVEAGVAVRGTILTPRISLVSEPPVAEAEKLSWLVLGHGLDVAGEGEANTLQRAAGALLSQGAAAGVQSRIASAFGLDTLSIGSDRSSLQERIVTLGKQISSRLYVSFERGLETATSVLHLKYRLNEKISLEGEAGTRSALSLFYNIAFD